MTDNIDNPNDQQQPDQASAAPDKSGVTGQQQQPPAWTVERNRTAERAGMKQLLTALGFEGLKEADDNGVKAAIEALKTTLGEHKAIKEANQSEAEKLAAKVTAAEAKAKAAEDRLIEIQQQRVGDSVNRAIEKAAKDAKNSSHVIKLIRDEKPDAVAALVDDKGDVDEKKAEKLVADFRQANPDYFGSGGVGSPSNRGGKVPGLKPKDIGNTFKL